MSPHIAIIDYGSGNLRSVAKAFEYCGRGKIYVTSDPDVVLSASHIVLPGVGAFGNCREGLFSISGMVDALQKSVINDKKPFLGICVGMQLMASLGEESGVHSGLNWLPGKVRALTPKDSSLKVPHMGWNKIATNIAHPVLEGLDQGAYVYFVHSYCFLVENTSDILACADYGGALTAVVGRDNLVGVQFHPEKSQAAGLRLIDNFLQWSPNIAPSVNNRA